jgi:hypothetical protein
VTEKIQFHPSKADFQKETNGTVKRVFQDNNTDKSSGGMTSIACASPGLSVW